MSGRQRGEGQWPPGPGLDPPLCGESSMAKRIYQKGKFWVQSEEVMDGESGEEKDGLR